MVSRVCLDSFLHPVSVCDGQQQLPQCCGGHPFAFCRPEHRRPERLQQHAGRSTSVTLWWSELLHLRGHAGGRCTHACAPRAGSRRAHMPMLLQLAAGACPHSIHMSCQCSPCMRSRLKPHATHRWAKYLLGHDKSPLSLPALPTYTSKT